MSPKDAYWFQHDANARRDPKVLALITDYGTSGYGRFWIIVELLREAEGYRLPRDRYLARTLAAEWRCPIDESKDFLDKLINEYELLAADDTSVWSESLNRRMEPWDRLRETNKKKAEQRWKQQHDEQSHGKEVRR